MLALIIHVHNKSYLHIFDPRGYKHRPYLDTEAKLNQPMRTGGDSSDGVRNLVLVCVLPIVGGLMIIAACYFLLVRRRPCAKQELNACEVKDTKQPAKLEKAIPSAPPDVQSKKNEPLHIKPQMSSPREGQYPDKVSQVSIANKKTIGAGAQG